MNRSRTPLPRRPSALALVTLALLLAGGAYLFARPYLRATAPTPGEAAPDVILRISMSGWQPAILEARAGVPLRVRMVNLDNRFHTDGGGWHDFVVPTLGVDQHVPPEGTLTFEVTALAPGEYLFYCDVCCGGKDNPYMQGKLIVS